MNILKLHAIIKANGINAIYACKKRDSDTIYVYHRKGNQSFETRIDRDAENTDTQPNIMYNLENEYKRDQERDYIEIIIPWSNP